MSRVKRGVTSHAKHKKVYKAAKGFYGRRKNTIRAAKAAVEKAGQYAFRDRKRKKRTFRVLDGEHSQQATVAMTDLAQLESQILAEVAAAGDEAALEIVRVAALGKKG